MADDERKSRLHIHLGGLVILIIILLILFKVDIRSKIQSPQFQENYTYITGQIKIAWTNYIVNPIKSKLGASVIDITNKGLEKWQNNFKQNVLNIDPATNLEVENNNTN